MKERRRYFRINDTVQLKHQIIHEESIDAEIQQNLYHQNRLVELRKSYTIIDTHLLVLLEKLKSETPLLAEALSLINKKTLLLEQITSIQGEYDESMYPMQQVNLSASGIAFGTYEPLAQNTRLKIELILYPECYYIVLYAQVVNCKETVADSAVPYPFIIAAEFVQIGEEGRDKIIQHVLKKQAEDLSKDSDATPDDVLALKEI